MPLALQLYSLRRETAGNAEQILRQVPSLGYDAVELAGTYDWSPEKWNGLLAETKLAVISAHAGFAALETEWEKTVAFYRAIKCPALIVPSVPGDLRNATGFKHAATRLNALGQRAKDEGFSFGYHNHAFEFDGPGMDILLAETDPALVRFEVDPYWVERGGRDSRSFIEQHASRVGWIHAKDLRKRDNGDVPAGEGDIDFKTIIPLARQKHWPVIVEFEGANAVEAVAASAKYLRTL